MLIPPDAQMFLSMTKALHVSRLIIFSCQIQLVTDSLGM